MTHPERSRRRRLLLIVASLALFATACGGASTDPAATAAAETNEGSLLLNGDISQTQMLDVNSGEITSLSEVVTGDRAVLAWYWAPH